jgi:hypothetical protein
MTMSDMAIAANAIGLRPRASVADASADVLAEDDKPEADGNNIMSSCKSIRLPHLRRLPWRRYDGLWLR